MFEQIHVEQPTPGVAIIHAPERFDVYTAPAVREIHMNLVSRGVYSQTFDLTDTRYLDSTAMGVLVGALKRLRTHSGVTVLDSPTASVRHTLTVTGLTKIFHIVETVTARSEA